MKAKPLSIGLSKFDEKRFGIRTAHAANIQQENLNDVLGYCKENGVVFLVARCETRETRAIHAMQRAGFMLMGSLIRYSVDVDKIAHPPDVEIYPVRPVKPGEEDEVRAVAVEAFRGYRSHYHADKRLDPEKCDGIYASIAYESCSRDSETSIVNVCKLDGEIIGFDIYCIPSAGVGEAELMGIAPLVQKRGISWSFIQPGKVWLQSKNASIVNCGTQITNIAAQKSILSQNYMPYKSIHIYHKWFE